MTDVDDAQRVRRELRGAAANLDHAELSRLVVDASVQPQLQEAGEAVLRVAEADPVNTAGAARELATRLTDRGWAGDEELAELVLELVEGRTSDRRRIRAELEGVTELLEGPLEMGFGGVLDCETGNAWPEAVIEDWAGDGDPPDPETDPERYLFVPNEGSRHAWQDMRDFADTVGDVGVRDQLLDAIDGRGAFSRFRRVLDRHDDLRANWHTYKAETSTGRARQWLAGQGYDALPPAP